MAIELAVSVRIGMGGERSAVEAVDTVEDYEYPDFQDKAKEQTLQIFHLRVVLAFRA